VLQQQGQEHPRCSRDSFPPVCNKLVQKVLETYPSLEHDQPTHGSFKSATTAGGGFTVGLMLALRAAAEKNVSLEAFDH
jgi:hypothetical protein